MLLACEKRDAAWVERKDCGEGKGSGGSMGTWVRERNGIRGETARFRRVGRRTGPRLRRGDGEVYGGIEGFRGGSRRVGVDKTFARLCWSVIGSMNSYRIDGTRRKCGSPFDVFEIAETFDRAAPS